MAKNADEKVYLETHVNNVAKSIRDLSNAAKTARVAVNKTNATKIANYLRIQVENLASDLQRLAETNVPQPGEFSLDADIPAPPAANPTTTVFRAPEPEGRLVGQRAAKPAGPTPDTEEVSFIDD